jgi:Fe-S-cluster-containing dehydrogenase component
MQDTKELGEMEMRKTYAILVDLDRCVGCQACEIACKQENNLKEGQNWISVVTIGPEEVGGKLCADYYPVINGGCPFCRQRISQGLEPFCVTVCPTKALEFHDESGVLAALRSKRRYQICGTGEIEE